MGGLIIGKILVKKLAVLVVIIVVIIIAVGVGVFLVRKEKGPIYGYGTPKETIFTYVNAVNNRNTDVVFESYSNYIQNMVPKDLLQEDLNELEGWTIKKYIIENVTVSISGDKAKVYVNLKVTYTPGSLGMRRIKSSAPLVKESGGWKIDFYFPFFKDTPLP